ncbi:argininosuccinate lyase [Streptomyces mashuensis]|uniref:Argininosuccinate lyase n=1 Tax=Streptomyces mashuensis TaxID=33904 RepID=A0A919BA21_9ACTN|nr:ATP-grasp domain-containing protein [Streptomyces mashuensis]GHF69385.1 argininosuccinate lyase [Streptomyces mashuensis]
MTAFLLLVESNTTGTGREFARQAADLGAVPVLVAADPGRYPYVREDGLRHAVADTTDPRAVLDVAAELRHEGEVRGVTSSSEYYVPVAATVARALGLPGPDPQRVTSCRHKGEQRRTLHAAGVPVPGFAVVTTEAEAEEAALRLGPPVVVKPVLGSGSLGVRLCPDGRTAAKHAADLLSRTANERGMSLPREVLVESYLTGREFSVETFGTDVVTVVAKHVGPLPDFVETGHDVPAAVPDGLHDELADVAVRAVRALGLGWGAAHTEIRLEDGRAHVVEVNPRLAGGRIPDLVRLALGTDLVRAQVAAALGEPAPPAAARHGHAAIRFLTADGPGTVGATDEALAGARAVTGVADAALYRTPGEPARRATDFRDRLGHVIAAADGPGRARQAAEDGLARLRTALQHHENPGETE